MSSQTGAPSSSQKSAVFSSCLFSEVPVLLVSNTHVTTQLRSKQRPRFTVIVSSHQSKHRASNDESPPAKSHRLVRFGDSIGFSRLPAVILRRASLICPLFCFLHNTSYITHDMIGCPTSYSRTTSYITQTQRPPPPPSSSTPLIHPFTRAYIHPREGAESTVVLVVSLRVD